MPPVDHAAQVGDFSGWKVVDIHGFTMPFFVRGAHLQDFFMMYGA